MPKTSTPKEVRKNMLHTVPFNTKQGAPKFDSIKDKIISSKELGRGRPSLKDGRWKLDNGDWAHRQGAQFTKINGEWVETTVNEKEVAKNTAETKEVVTAS